MECKDSETNKNLCYCSCASICLENGIASRGSAGTIDPGKKRGTEVIKEVELGHAGPKSHLLPGSGWALGQVFWLVTMQALLGSVRLRLCIPPGRISTAHLCVQETEWFSSTH